MEVFESFPNFGSLSPPSPYYKAYFSSLLLKNEEPDLDPMLALF
jgi:hypothetical protein